MTWVLSDKSSVRECPCCERIVPVTEWSQAWELCVSCALIAKHRDPMDEEPCCHMERVK